MVSKSLPTYLSILMQTSLPARYNRKGWILNGRLWTPKRRVAVLLRPWVRPTISTVTCTSLLTWQDAAGGSGQEAHSPGVLPKPPFHLSGVLCLVLPRAPICPSPERNMGFRVTCPQIALQMMSEHSFAKKKGLCVLQSCTPLSSGQRKQPETGCQTSHLHWCA